MSTKRTARNDLQLEFIICSSRLVLQRADQIN